MSRLGCLTCSQAVESWLRLHPVADRPDGYRVVPAGLEIANIDSGLLHSHTGAVSL